jgi:FtsP/CotA-like multicopper oxidase with cupredoxin domain
MDKRQRITLLGIAAAIAVAAVVIALVAGGGDDDNPETTTATQATETQPPQQDTTTATEEAEPPEAEPTRIRVEGGEPVGGAEDIDVKKDETVEIEVTADAADEAHLHGYDITKELGPGKTARFRFKADIEGIFEIELEGSHTPIAELRVEP